MSEVTTARVGRGRLYATVAGTAGLVGLSTAGAAVVAGLDALVKVRTPNPIAGATLVRFGPPRREGCELSVTLAGPTADNPGSVGLLAGRGRLLAGPPVPVPDGWERQVVSLPGAEAPWLEPGQRLVVTNDPWGGCEDPLRHGATTEAYPTALGPVTVTSVSPSGGSRRALVYLHGRGGQRLTGWWLAPTAVAAGWRAVMPAYRNDPDEGPSTGRYLLGGEWVDLVAVLDRLAIEGVEEVVLAGWSMGGNIAASYLRQRRATPALFAEHPVIRGLVLDAAALDWGVVLRHVARARRLPHRFVPAVMAYGERVNRIDWRGLNHLLMPEHLELPILAFHGTADAVVPISVTESLVDALPHARFAPTEGAGHCASVNLDPVGYLGHLRNFLDDVTGPSKDGRPGP